MRRLGIAAVVCAVWGPAWGAAPSAGAAAAVQPRIILQLGHAAPISAAAFTPDGRFLVTGSSDRQLLVWDLAGRVVNRAPLPGGDHRGRAVVRRIAVSPDGRGAAIEQLLFRHVWDNGSTAVKAGLIGRQDWPRSALGWTLAARGGRLALIPPDPAAAAVSLAGARGPDLDADDQLAEATARAWDAATRAMSAGRPSKKDDEGKLSLEPPLARKPLARKRAAAGAARGKLLNRLRRRRCVKHSAPPPAIAKSSFARSQSRFCARCDRPAGRTGSGERVTKRLPSQRVQNTFVQGAPRCGFVTTAAGA